MRARQGAGHYSATAAGGSVSAETANRTLEYATLIAFVALAAVAFAFWLRRRDRPSLWAALCFGTLGAVALAGRLIPEDPSGRVGYIEQRLLILALLFFPYLLYRFAAAFEPVSRRTEWLVNAATLGLALWTFALPDFPSEGEERTLAFNIYIFGLLVYWGALSLYLAVRLWRAGSEEPSVPRRRMRLLSFAAATMTMALLLAGANTEEEPALGVAVSLLALLAAVTFGLGLSPPQFLRLQWRQPELEKVRDATSGLVAATTPDQVTAEVLPPMAEVVGARRVFLRDAEGAVLASYGAPKEALESVLEDERGVMTIEIPGGGAFVVQSGPYSPFFGSEEVELLRSVGALTRLALDRADLFVQEREAREQLERADELKTNFIALAAHELRTPVTSVHGVVSTLDRLGDRLSEQDRAELDDALRTQTERLRRLVEQLLDLSRLDADSVAIHPVAIPVREQVEELVDASAGNRAADVEIEIAEDLTAKVDQTVFDRVVSNLLTNALRHGAPPIRVTAERQNRHFRIAVQDCGEGVPEGFVRDLFERFSRSDEARARGLGSGLGLSIARSYAQAHGGELVYAKALPKGARFELVVPQNSASERQD